jgi:hypothetical protein
MPSTIIASPQLSLGGLVLLSQNASFQDDGTHDYKADYACLTQFASQHTGKFVVGAPPPIDRPAHLARSSVRLYDISIESDRGITYFRASYGGFDFTIEESETEQVKTFAATKTFRFTNSTIYYSLSFDYVSKAVTRTSKFGYWTTEAYTELVGPPYNVRQSRSVEGDPVNFSNNNFPVRYKKDKVIQRSSTRAANGITTYSTTSTGIYVEQ